MSRNLQQLLKRFIIIAIFVVAGGGGAIVLYRSAMEARTLQYEKDRLQRSTERQKGESPASRTSPARASAPQPLPPPVQGSAAPSGNRVAHISNIAFSPDGKFVSAMVEYSTTSQLMLWPASGGSTLYRHEPHYYRADHWFWHDKTHLLSSGKTWRFQKNDGRWQLTSARRIHAFGLPNGNSDNDARDFPDFDLRLILKGTRATQNNPFVLRSTLEAYALSSGVRLPLPEQLKTDDRIDRVAPLARWGKAPLRIALWIENEQRTPQGPRENSLLEVWDARAKKRLWQKSVAASPGKLLVAGQGRWIVAAGTPEEISRADKASARNGAIVFNASTGARQAAVTAPGLKALGSRVSPDGKLLALYTVNHNRKTGRFQKQLALYDLPKLRLLKKLAITSREELPEFAFSADNRWLAVEDENQIILLDWKKAASTAAPQQALRL